MPNLKTAFRKLRRMDYLLVAAVVALLATGLAFVFSAGFRGGALGMMSGLYGKQACWVCFSTVVFLFFVMLDYSLLLKFAWLFYAGGLILLCLLFVPGMGFQMYGATRWLGVAGVRLIQPAELVKIAVIIALARLLGSPSTDLSGWKPIVASLAVVAAPMFLIIAQPDLGTALVFLPVVFVMMFCAGVRMKPLLILALTGLIAVGLVMLIILVPEWLGWDEETKTRILKWCGLKMYHRDRIMAFLNSDLDPLGVGWSKRQSQIAVGSGQLWGKGYLKGTQNILGFLPRTVAPTDFIFSVVAEEKGFVGATSVISLFGLVIWRGLRTATRAGDKSARLLCAGLITVVFCHVFINTAMAIGLLPITGLPLPLLSYGGTFLTGTMASFGIIQSVHVRTG